MSIQFPSIAIEVPRQLPAALRGWTIGQIVDANVIGRIGANSIRLDVAGVEVRAATALPLRTGERLQLEVTRLQPVVTLAPRRAVVSPERALVTAAATRLLPRQQPLPTVLDALRTAAGAIRSAAAAATPDRAATLAPETVSAAERVLERIPAAREIADPQRLPALVRASGVFAERALAALAATRRSPDLPAEDLKWQLERLRGTAHSERPSPRRAASAPPPPGPAATRPATRAAVATPVLASAATGPRPADAAGRGVLPDADPEPVQRVVRLVDAAIAKIESNQLKAVAAVLDGEPRIQLEIPYATADGFREIRMQITRDGESGIERREDSHTIEIEVPIDDTATLRAALTQNGESLSIRLWSADERVRAAIARERARLIERLASNGIDDVRLSIVELARFDDGVHAFDRLVDTRA